MNAHPAKAVLAVIFGAGASHDSVPPEERRVDPDWQPPLANDLFASRANFRAILGKEGIREAMPIAHEMRRLQSGETLEQRLERLVEMSATYEPLERQLRATQLYLQQLLWDCGDAWVRGANFVTNYSDLLGRLDRWRFLNHQEVAYITFNYDTILESGLPDPPASVPKYTQGHTRVYKLHGSVNWGRRAVAPTRLARGGDWRPSIVKEGDRWELTNDYQMVQDVNGVDPGGYPLLPVIAVPTITKSSFALPPEQLEQLRADLSRVRGMLVVGWKGNEAHFLAELRAHLPSHIPVDVVSPSDPRSTAEKLRQLDKGVRTRPLSIGFSQYMDAPQHLDALLAQAMSPDRGAAHW